MPSGQLNGNKEETTAKTKKKKKKRKGRTDALFIYRPAKTEISHERVHLLIQLHAEQVNWHTQREPL